MLARLIRRPGEYATPIIATVGVLALLLVSQYNLVVFSVLVQLFSVIVSVAMFMVAYNARRLIQVGLVKYVTLVMFFVGAMKLAHVLAHPNLHVFAWADRNLPSQICVIGQVLRSSAMLIATSYVRRDVRLKPAFALYAVLYFLIVFVLFIWRIFPDAWVAGIGYTPLKMWGALLGASVALMAAANLWRQREHIEERTLLGLMAFLGLAAIGDMLLASHAGQGDIYTLLGQLVRFGSTVVLYYSVVESSLSRPMNHIFQNLAASEQRFRTVADFTHDWEIWQTPDGRLEYISPACERITGYAPERFRRNPALLLEIVHPEDRDALREHMWRHAVDHEAGEVDFRITTKRGEHRWIGHVCVPVYHEGEFMGIRASNRDITARKQAESQRQQLIDQLEQTLAGVHTLSGLIPICASCKKVRTPEGEWQSVEEYVQARTEAGFTHGICPDCMTRLYPELTPKELADIQAADSAASQDASSSAAR